MIPFISLLCISPIGNRILCHWYRRLSHVILVSQTKLIIVLCLLLICLQFRRIKFYSRLVFFTQQQKVYLSSNAYNFALKFICRTISEAMNKNDGVNYKLLVYEAWKILDLWVIDFIMPKHTSNYKSSYNTLVTKTVV